jgi:hypothetical protein
VRNRTPIYWSYIPHPRQHAESSVSDCLRKAPYHGVSLKGPVKAGSVQYSLKGPVKAGSVQYSLPGVEEKTRTLNLRIKIGRMNTEPMKSVRGKSLSAFTMYKMTHASLNCGSQAESSPQFFTRVCRPEFPTCPGSTQCLATFWRTISRDV